VSQATGLMSLCISASGGGYSCALQLPDGELLSDPGDGQQLAPVVARLFERADSAPTSLRELRLDLGPGSYTGLRVAVTFARTLQAFGEVEVLTATSLELLALRAWDRGLISDQVTVRPILDARRARFHHAAIQLEDRVALMEPPAAVSLEDLSHAINGDDALLVEPSVLEQVEAIAAARGCTVRTLERDRDLAGLLLDPRLAPRRAEPADLEPLYLMGTYAD